MRRWGLGSADRALDNVASATVTIVIILTVLFLVLPLFVTVIMALDSRQFMGNLPPPALTTKWFAELFRQPEYFNGAKTSLFVGALSASFSTLAGVLYAIAYVRFGEFKGRGAITHLVMAPLVVPAVVTGYGMVAWFAVFGGLNAVQRLIVAHIVITLPYTIRVITAMMVKADRALEEAAMGLGAGPLRTFTNVTLPMIRPALVGAAVMAFAVSIGDVAVSVFLVDPGTMTLPIVVFSQLRASMTPAIAAASVYLMLAIATALLIVEWVYGIGRLFGLAGPRGSS